MWQRDGTYLRTWVNGRLVYIWPALGRVQVWPMGRFFKANEPQWQAVGRLSLPKLKAKAMTMAVAFVD